MIQDHGEQAEVRANKKQRFRPALSRRKGRKRSVFRVRRMAAAVGMLGALVGGGTARAQSSDALLDKLVEKGILTVKEANELREETDKNFNSALSVKTGMPEWVQALKWTAEFRGRYDGIFQDPSNVGPNPPAAVGNPAANTYATNARDRFRYRIRFGVTGLFNDNFELGIRLGAGDPSSAAPSLGGSIFSPNTTFNNDAARKFIWVDLAYGRWTPTKWLDLSFGKMNNYFWASEMIFDPDYNPEGAQERLTYEINDKHRVGITSGQWVIAENFSANGTGVNNDAYVFVNQADWQALWSPKVSTRVGVGMYNFLHQYAISSFVPGGGGTPLDSNPNVGASFINQNGIPASGNGSQNFNPIFARGELTYNLDTFPMYTGAFLVTFAAEYAYNPAAGTDTTSSLVPKYNGRGNVAYNLGVQLGSAKAKGNWQIAYSYKHIEAASVWHGLNDDDFGFNTRGGTDVEGHQIKAFYHPYDAMTLSLSYFITQEISSFAGSQAHQQRLFLDCIIGF